MWVPKISIAAIFSEAIVRKFCLKPKGIFAQMPGHGALFARGKAE
jgi:hypothetical protein